ncbi:MAG: DNA protecting protein DprA [Betaproteobacteria bacterium RIFCSPLOWO2_12_FULL_63_13]|nr:MAG: DNA protecting protein DprA [Betaproteobacteria bacterium RIFCSPLOWO2_02_FULL_63_19]OGA46943.1 MAG: DNA protecting protein DprA [Betaproteobacteria bacterium RIFCSPLOWO2_12_FULL_63_13]
MSSSGDLASWIDLSLVPGLGPRAYRALLTAFGLPEKIRSASRAQLSRVVPEAIAARILEGDRTDEIARALEWVEPSDRSVITLADPGYPRQLLQIPDPPVLLYVTGQVRLLSADSLAIVGSRNATPQGVTNAERFARAMSEAGLVIISGLALGIDAAAHRGGLDGSSSTIAVLGCGADVVYPLDNKLLFARIAETGAIISEYPLGTPPARENFPRRNRVIAGLSRGCLVVEAALASGSLITARFALEQGREVFAIPGSIHSPLSKGCHALIKQGAKLVESAQDVLEELGLDSRFPEIHNSSGASSGLLQHMGYDPCTIDTLVQRSDLTAEVISAMLLTLELEGKVSSLPGGVYQRIS